MKRSIFFLLIFYLSSINCYNLLFEKNKPKNRLYISTITDYLTNVGFFKNKQELLDHTIVVYTMYSGSQELAPNVLVEIIQNKDTVLITSDSSARVYLELNKNYLQKETYLKAKDSTNYVYFTFNASGHRNGKGSPQIVNIKNYQPLFSKDSLVIIFYGDEQIKLAQKYLTFIKKQFSALKDLFGFSPLYWGILLAKEKKPIHFFEPMYLKNNIKFYIFAYSISSDSMAHILFSNIHEWCESTLSYSLKTKHPNIRWIKDGISEFSRVLFAENLSIKERKRIGLQKELKKEISKYFKFIKTKYSMNNKLSFDLTNWSLASSENVYSDKDKLGYPLSLYFWITIKKKYGIELISTFLTKAIEIENAQNQDYIQLLTKLTGEDINSKLSQFVIDDILSTLEIEARRLEIPLTE